MGDAQAAGHRLRLLARRTPDGRDDGLERRPFDLGEVEPIDPAVLEGCGALVHLAAHIPSDHHDPAEAERCWRLNALGTLRLMQAAARAGVQRVVQLTSANAYAPHVERPDETAAMFPAGRVFYLSSKIAQELYADGVCRPAGIRLATLRVSSVYGPGQAFGALPRLASKMLIGETVSLADGGRFGADFVTIGDVSQALLLMLGTDATGAYNVGSGVRSTIADVSARLARLTGTGPGRIRLEAEDAEADRGFPALEIARIAALGYRPTGLDEGLGDFVAWLRSGKQDRARASVPERLSWTPR